MAARRVKMAAAFFASGSSLAAPASRAASAAHASRCAAESRSAVQQTNRYDKKARSKANKRNAGRGVVRTRGRNLGDLEQRNGADGDHGPVRRVRRVAAGVAAGRRGPRFVAGKQVDHRLGRQGRTVHEKTETGAVSA